MLPQPLQNLIEELNKFPSIGPKAAQRLAFHLLYQPKENLDKLISAIAEIKKETHICPNCFNVTENSSESKLCRFCSDPKRNSQLICVVEECFDIIPIEKTRQFNGLYHILGGAINPPKGITPDKLKINELFQRVKNSSVTEIIIATNPNSEGETTAMYLARTLKSLAIKTTRLARGLPTGAAIQYADEATLGSAISNRQEY